MERTGGRELHGKAEMAREAGHFEEALQFTDQALIAYDRDKDTLGFAEVLGSRFLTLRHLYEQTSNEHFMILAKHEAMAGVEIAEKSGDNKALAIPHARLAQAHATLKNWNDAAHYFKKAVENMETNAPKYHDRPAVVSDMKAQLAQAEYMTGDTTAKERLDAAIEELLQVDELPYNRDVWLSGAYMRGAEMLHRDNPEMAQDYLAKAKEVIDGNDELHLRRQQWEKLSEKLGA